MYVSYHSMILCNKAPLDKQEFSKDNRFNMDEYTLSKNKSLSHEN